MREVKPVAGARTTPLPGMAAGFALATAFAIVEFGEGIVDPNAGNDITIFDRLIAVSGSVYWLTCIYRMHKVLAEATDSSHPISPARGAFFNLIPFFNLYWVFRWTNQIARFVNRSSKTRMAIGWPGFFLLLGYLLASVDSALFLLVTFGVGTYLNRKIRQALPVEATSSGAWP
jgi:hypothetical protein